MKLNTLTICSSYTSATLDLSDHVYINFTFFLLSLFACLLILRGCQSAHSPVYFRTTVFDNRSGYCSREKCKQIEIGELVKKELRPSHLRASEEFPLP